jgi:hypothetical protein
MEAQMILAGKLALRKRKDPEAISRFGVFVYANGW